MDPIIEVLYDNEQQLNQFPYFKNIDVISESKDSFIRTPRTCTSVFDDDPTTITWCF